MRALSLLLLLVPCAVLAAQPNDLAAEDVPRIRVGSALSPEAAPSGVPTTFEPPADPVY